MSGVIDAFVEFWRDLWSVLGPVATLLLIIAVLYIRKPEGFERIAVHLSWALSRINERFERSAISREVKHLVSSVFAKNFAVDEVPEIIVEWGNEDRAIVDLEAGKLIVVLKRGRKNRFENIAKALMAAIPDLLAPEMKAVYDERLLNCISAHVARSIAKEYQPIVTAINEAIGTLTKDNEDLRKLASMLVEIDDQSLLSRILIPELVEVAKLRYPHRDPSIDDEVLALINMLHKLARGEELKEPVVYGKYVRVMFVRVARPEKIEAMLEPHVHYVKHVLGKYRGIRSIYILAAGKNVDVAKALRMLLENELKAEGMRITTNEYVYEGRYRDAPRMKLYVGRVRIE